MLTPHKESQTPYKAQQEILKTMNALYTFKANKGTKNWNVKITVLSVRKTKPKPKLNQTRIKPRCYKLKHTKLTK